MFTLLYIFLNNKKKSFTTITDKLQKSTNHLKSIPISNLIGVYCNFVNLLYNFLSAQFILYSDVIFITFLDQEQKTVDEFILWDNHHELCIKINKRFLK